MPGKKEPTKANAQRTEPSSAITRREALRKLGVTSALSILTLFSADDLARMAARALRRHAGDNKLAVDVARSFENAGIALAAGNDTPCDGPPSARNRAEYCSSSCVSSYCMKSGYTAAQCRTCVGQVYGPNGYCNGYSGFLGGNISTADNVCDVNCSPTCP